MKKLVGIIGLCMAYTLSIQADSASFGQRFGVNGYLTSLPLYYKDRRPYNADENLKKRKLRKQRAQRATQSTPASGNTLK